MRLVRFFFRIVRNTIGAVLVLLLIGAVVLWVRGRWNSDEIAIDWVNHQPGAADVNHSTQIVLGSNIYMNDKQPDASPATQPTTAHATTQPSSLAKRVELRSIAPKSYPGSIESTGPGDTAKFSALGFEFGQIKSDSETVRWTLVPHWLLTGVLAIPALLWLTAYLRPRRRMSLTCTSCHHDLTSPIRRCPECGAQLNRPLRVR
jgi:hypothetical protein